MELAARHGTKSPRKKFARYNYTNFAGFIDSLQVGHFLSARAGGLRSHHPRLVEELIRQNVVYAEITISAGVMLRRMQNVEANFAAIRETSQSVPFQSPPHGMDFRRRAPIRRGAAMEVARWASKLHNVGRGRLRHGRR